MFSSDSFQQRCDDAAQAALPGEPVLAAVQVGRANGEVTLALSAVSGLGALLSMRRQKQRAAGLPQLFFLAVTPERLYALAAKSSVRPKAGKVLASWPVADVRASSAPALTGTRITLDIAGGTRIECQGPDGEPSDRVVRALGHEAVAA